MYKKNFVSLVRRELVDRFTEKFGGKLSMEDADHIIQTVFRVIGEVIASGDEVRILPYGRFYPKIMRRHRKAKGLNIKLGFSSYKKTDKWLTSVFDRSNIEND